MSLAVKEILNIGKNQLEDKGITDAAIDSKILYCFMMNLSSAQLVLEYQRILPDNLCDEYFSLLDRRCEGVPVQYIIGTQEFMGISFKVNEDVLIPRQDTETLVEDALEVLNSGTLRGEPFLKRKNKEFDILDLCCGSGAIGISLACLYQNAKVICSDVSQGALTVARGNAETAGVSKRVSFEYGNLFTPFKGKFKNRKFDFIISNPPYIRSSVIQTLQTEVKDHEPMMALDGGADGLDFYKRIISEAADFLKKDGFLMLEIGHDQRDDIIEMLERTEKFENIRGLKDLAGRDRIIAAVLAGKKK